MMFAWLDFIREERGAVIAEYAVLAASIAAVLTAALAVAFNNLGDTIAAAINGLAKKIPVDQ